MNKLKCPYCNGKLEFYREIIITEYYPITKNNKISKKKKSIDICSGNPFGLHCIECNQTWSALQNDLPIEMEKIFDELEIWHMN